ncbi:MAG: sigma-70 family RNA polymerase sigma factor, partial [Acidobacteriota bacterium]|nr:sigma-70 family RNA polymerase sigma factor [Acidobacteriota bacterium]
AFSAVYRMHHNAVYRFALHMSGNGHVAEEVTQEVFLLLMRETGSFDARRGSLGAYLYGIARNFVRRHLERDRAWDTIEDTTRGPVALDDPLGELTRPETIETVRQAILTLPPNYREAVVLCELQELSYEEAASAIGCAVGTVRSRLHRGRAILTGKLQSRCLV